jgi:hypothetical protein
MNIKVFIHLHKGDGVSQVSSVASGHTNTINFTGIAWGQILPRQGSGCAALQKPPTFYVWKIHFFISKQA